MQVFSILKVIYKRSHITGRTNSVIIKNVISFYIDFSGRSIISVIDYRYCLLNAFRVGLTFSTEQYEQKYNINSAEVSVLPGAACVTSPD